MKIRDYVNYDLMSEEETHVPLMYELPEGRWNEIVEQVIACFDSTPTISAAYKMFDKHFEIRNVKELQAVLFIFNMEHGRLDGENRIRTHGEQLVTSKRIARVKNSGTWLKKNGFEITQHLKDFATKAIMHLLGLNNGINVQGANIEVIGFDDNRHPYTNKNKFKEDDFNIPDPNKPEEGDKDK